MEKQSNKTSQDLPELLPGPFQDEFDAFRKYYNVIITPSVKSVASQLVDDIYTLPHKDCCKRSDQVKIKTDQNVKVPDISAPSKTIEFAHELIRIDETRSKGRGLVATGNFEVGDLLINEKATVMQVDPLCICLEGEHKMYRCHHCACAVHKFYSCTGCNIVAYCSTSCLIQSYYHYHRFECEGFQRHFWKLGKTDFSYIAFRMVLYGARYGFDKSVPSHTKWGKNGYNYPYMYKLVSNFNKLPLKLVYEILEKGARTVMYLAIRTNFFKTFQEDNEDGLHMYIGGLFVKHYCQAQVNAIQVKFPNFDSGYSFNVTGGTGKAICPTIALINHSCSPNAVVIPRNNQFLVKAIKPIKKDEEITIAYHEINIFLPYDQRRLLMSHYFFFQTLCNCSFCVHENSWFEYAYRCKLCSNGRCKKVQLNNDEWTLACNTCLKHTEIALKNEKAVDIAIKWYQSTYEIDPLLRVLSCYQQMFPHDSWMLLDLYRILFEKYSAWGEWPVETIKYGLNYFECVENYVCRLYPPLLEAKLKFFFNSVNSREFSTLIGVSDEHYDIINHFAELCGKVKKDVMFYVPNEYMDFYHLGLLKKLDDLRTQINQLE